MEISARFALRIFFGAERADIFHAKYGLIQGPLSEEADLPQLINSLGFSKPDFTARKPAQTFRVLLIGGSAAAGSLANELRSVLEKNCPRRSCEVIDGGVPGAVSSHELFNLIRWLNYDPDLVLIYDGWNDQYYSHYTPKRYEEQNQLAEKQIKNWARPSTYLRRHSCLLQGTHLLQKGMKHFFQPALAFAAAEKLDISWMGGMTTFEIDPAAAIEDHFSEIYRNHLMRMGEELRKRNVKAVFILQPSAAAIYLKNPEKNNLMNGLREPVRENWVDAIRILHPLAKKVQEETAQQHRYPFIDFNEFPDLDPSFFTDQVHLSTDGNRWVAKKLVELLKEKKIL